MGRIYSSGVVKYNVGAGSSTAVIRLKDGTVGAPSLTMDSDTTMGMYKIASNQLGFSIAGVKRLTVNAVGIAVAGGITVSGGTVGQGITDIGATLALTTTTARSLVVTQATCTITLPASVPIWGASSSLEWYIVDEWGILTTCDIYPYDGLTGTFTSINENDPVNGVWVDSWNSGTGPNPAGPFARLVGTGTVGQTWRLAYARNNPGVALAATGNSSIGGWILHKLSTGGY